MRVTPRLDDYGTKYRNARMDRTDGILEVTLHTDGGNLVWGHRPHASWGTCSRTSASTRTTRSSS